MRTLESALEISNVGQIQGLTYGFSDQGIDDNLLTACEALLFTLRAGFSLGKIPEMDVNAIHNAHLEFNSLLQTLSKPA